MASLTTDIQYIKDVGQMRVKAMNKLGIFTLEDLIMHFPRDYEDRRALKRINELSPGENVCVCGIVAAPPRLSHIRKGLDLVKLKVYDDTGELSITFFNQAYIKDSLETGKSYVFYGKTGGSLTKPEMTNPVFERENTAGNATRRIVPVYRLSAGLNGKTMANAVRQGLDSCMDFLPEPVPFYIREKYSLASATFAYESIHFPGNENDLLLARRKLIF